MRLNYKKTKGATFYNWVSGLRSPISLAEMYVHFNRYRMTGMYKSEFKNVINIERSEMMYTIRCKILGSDVCILQSDHRSVEKCVQSRISFSF
jgi:hypothetical protein